ncbi:RCC1 domain-containing protein [Mammaliicoccus sciuri]|uniref:hypothetical protein n=1 Tax=Mammaliicoccus sciuri TaxID=1296 RepID=UPI002DB5669A|nr:hypothetical protein [Mammaliicoccus sciuri]MEB6196569.1 hypothetical protein [Mammaliicoccus sciuri]
MNILINQYKRISAGSRHVLIREKDNKVIAKGNNKNSQCNVDLWRNIKLLSAGNVHKARNTGNTHSVGLMHSGSVIGSGNNQHGQIDVHVWQNVIDIDCGWMHTDRRELFDVIPINHNHNRNK